MRWLFDLLERFDWILLAAVLTLTGIGLVALYGIGVSHEPADLFIFYKQMAAGLIGLCLVFSCIALDYRHLRSFSFLLYLGGGLLLTLVLFLGQTVNATQGWFRIGTLSFQPIEIAKVTLVIYLSSLFVSLGHGRLTWRLFGLSGTATLVYVVLTMMQPDFGSAMVLVAIWGALCLFLGLPRRAWIILPLAAITLAASLWGFGLKPYQRDRITNFLNPAYDVRGSGYNAAQARIAIGSGGWFGKGIGEGSQARLRFLPEAATDFIFAVVGEELGFVGVTLCLSLFGLIGYRYIRIAEDSGDDFATLLLVGLSSIFIVHVFINAGMSLGIMPVTGLPMPFISAAASSLAVAFLSIAIAESVAVRRRGADTSPHA